MATTLSEDEDRANHQVRAKDVEAFFTRLNNLHDDFESKAGEFRADAKALYAEAAESLGVTRKVFKHAYQVHRSKKKLEAREAEFEDSERQNLELIRAALGEFADTDLGRAALQ